MKDNLENGYGICFNVWALDYKIKDELGLLTIISSLTAERGYCFASNAYLAELFNVTDVTISRRLKKLEANGYITIQYKKRGAQVVARYIRIVNKIYDIKDGKRVVNTRPDNDDKSSINIDVNGTINTDDNCTINTDVKDNIISINTISNNIINNNTSEKKEETTPVKSEREIELEKSFDEALANLPSSPIENCDNTKRNVSVTKGSTKKRTKKNCVRAEQLEDDEFYKPVYEAYRSAFFSLYDKGTIPNCGKYKSFVDDCLKRYRELELSNIQIRDLIVTAINNAKSDKFIVQKRFPIAMILSESVMPRLVDTVKTTDDPKVGVDFNSQNYGV